MPSILTYNICGNPFVGNIYDRVEKICDEIHLLSPDAVCLQEVSSNTIINIITNKLSKFYTIQCPEYGCSCCIAIIMLIICIIRRKIIAETLLFVPEILLFLFLRLVELYIGYKNDILCPNFIGTVILTKTGSPNNLYVKCFEEKGYLMSDGIIKYVLSYIYLKPNFIVCEYSDYLLCNCHLVCGNNTNARKNQIIEIMDYIGNRNAILCGDFNDNSVEDFVKAYGFINMTRNMITYKNSKISHQVDYIFVRTSTRNKLLYYSSNVFLTDNLLSDHYGLHAVF